MENGKLRKVYIGKIYEIPSHFEYMYNWFECEPKWMRNKQ